jgi:hypothetical protein
METGRLGGKETSAGGVADGPPFSRVNQREEWM